MRNYHMEWLKVKRDPARLEAHRVEARRWWKKHRAYARASNRRHTQDRADWLRGQKDKPCKGCKHKFHFTAMQFDHIRGKKFFIIARCGSVSERRLLAEIKKCDLVCTNCHAIRTWKRAH